MSDKEIQRLAELQDVRDHHITQIRAAEILNLSTRQITRLLQKYKVQGPAALAHTGRGQTSNSRLSEELRLKCLNIVSDQLHGFGPTLAHEKLIQQELWFILTKAVSTVVVLLERYY